MVMINITITTGDNDDEGKLSNCDIWFRVCLYFVFIYVRIVVHIQYITPVDMFNEKREATVT